MVTKSRRETSIKPRATAPTATSSLDDIQAFRVWAEAPTYADLRWQCVAAFQYLRDALDYIAALQDAGVDCVFQSPAHTSPVNATDRRVVWKPETV